MRPIILTTAERRERIRERYRDFMALHRSRQRMAQIATPWEPFKYAADPVIRARQEQRRTWHGALKLAWAGFISRWDVRCDCLSGRPSNLCCHYS